MLRQQFLRVRVLMPMSCRFRTASPGLPSLMASLLRVGVHGILIFNSEPSILNNTITANQGGFSGAGIWSGGDPFDQVPTFHPLIQGNTITRNTASRIGGGIGTWQRMAPEIIDNYIAFNQATEGDGGGIYLRLFPDDTGSIIRGNVIEDNYAGDHGGGFYAGAVLSGGITDFEFSWNVVSKNTADAIELTGESGGGIWLSTTDGWVHHNTIFGKCWKRTRQHLRRGDCHV